MAHSESPFTAFLPSPLKFDKPQTASNVTAKSKGAHSSLTQIQSASRAPLSPLSASALNGSPVSRSGSQKSLSRPSTPNSKAPADECKNSPSSAALRSASEDIFAAFISSPIHKVKSPAEDAATSSPALKSSKTAAESSPAASSPKSRRGSVCFDALTRAMSRDLNPEDMKRARAAVAGKLDFSSTVGPRDSSAMDVDHAPATSVAAAPTNAFIQEIEVQEVAQGQKRSVGNSPITKDTTTTHAPPAITPTKSKRSLKHQRQQSIKSKRDKVEFSGTVTVAAPAPVAEAAKTTTQIDEAAPVARTKGSPSRLAKQRLISRPSYKTRPGISVPSSNIRADQLRSSMEIDSSQLKAYMSTQETMSISITSVAPSTPISQGRTLSAIIGSPDDPLGASARKRSASETAPSTKNRSQTLDEAYLSFSGGVINGKRYDVYGFEESSIRAPVDAESVLKINETQERFWTHWLSSMTGNKSDAPSDTSDSSKVSNPDSSLKPELDDFASAPFSSVHPHTEPLSAPTPSPILQSMVYAGVPHYLRGRAWGHLIGLRSYRESHSPHPGYYGELRSRGKHSKWGNQIDLDLPRTFCGHLLFREKGEISSEFGRWSSFGENSMENDSKFVGVPKGQRLLSHVLNAYAFYNETVGYCQGMSFLAAMLLMVMEGEEEKVFWSLCAIMDSQGGRLVSYYEPGMAGVLEDVNLLRKLILLELPQLYQHFEKVGVDASFFATRWFLSFFTDLSHWSSVLRIWDLYMLQGHLALFRVALAILKSNLTDLLALKSCETLFPFLLNLPYNNLTPSLLLAVYRTIDINYLYGEVTAPDADAKYSTSHIHQSLPPLKASNNKKKSSSSSSSSLAHSGSSSSRSEKQEKYQKTLSKKQLQRLASRKKMNDALIDSSMGSAGASASAGAGSTAGKSELPTTPMPRKTRPTSMMVFASSSSSTAQQEEEDSTPKKSFFGRMWDKLKSPALGNSTSSASKAKPPTAEPKTPRPNEVSFASSPSSPSARQFSSKTSSSSTVASTPNATNTASPARSKSKRSIQAQSVATGSHSLATPVKGAPIDAKTIEECDKTLKERITSPKRRRDGDENAADSSATFSKTKSKKRIISWFASDTSSEATTWDGVRDEKSSSSNSGATRDRSASVTHAAKEAENQSLFMDEDERQAFIEFATSTPIRGIVSAQRGTSSTTPRPDVKHTISKDGRDAKDGATPRPSRSVHSNASSSADVPVMRLPPPPGDLKHSKMGGDAPKVGGGPMQTPQFASTPRPASSANPSTASQKKSSTSSSSQKGVLSPIEMDTSWIKRH